MARGLSQDAASRIGGLEHALKFALEAVAVAYGKNARAALEVLRDKTIYAFKQSGIPADREMEHAEVVRPALEAIELIFKDAIAQLKD